MATLDNQRIQYEARLKALLEGLSGGTIVEGGTILPSRLQIINYVKAKLDELVPEGEGIIIKLSDEPNVTDPYDLLINAHLDEATKNIILSAPLSVLVPTKLAVTEGTPFSEGALCGYIDLPANFLRLSQLMMTEWLRPVEIPLTPNSPKYKQQSNVHLRAGIAKPVAALNWRKNGILVTRTLEYYSVSSAHLVEQLLYMHDMFAEDFVAANPLLLPSLAWMCAGIIMQIIGLQVPYQMAMDQVKLSYVNL
jgi:hypothetical protein